MNPISEAIIEKARADIKMRVLFYVFLDVPAFVRIETGTYGRFIVTPDLPSSDETDFCWDMAGKVFSPPMEVPQEHIEEYFQNALHCLNVIRNLPLPEKRDIYQEAWLGCEPGQAVVCIDYETEGLREYFDPIVVDLRNELMPE